MNSLKGRVAIITGAGRGIGREHAMFCAAEGAKVVVNDLGVATDGTGTDASPAQQVVDEIVAAGGQAVLNLDDVSDWDGAQRLVNQAIDAFGDLHILINNAGILRDRMLAKMSVEEWDAVMRVHLRGHFCTSKWAAVHWREQSKAGVLTKRSIINTSSTSGLFGNAGQSNYGAAKTAIATFSIIANQELAPYGVRVNAIAPVAATRLTAQVGAKEPPKDVWTPAHPGNISPFVAYLATEECPIAGRVFYVSGGEVSLFQPFTVVDTIQKEGRWTVEELQEQASRFQDYRFKYGHPGADLLFRGAPTRR